jgi:myosin-1
LSPAKKKKKKKKKKKNCADNNIGPVLVSLNPYRLIPDLYGEAVIEGYIGMNRMEVPPHIYSVAEAA